MLFFAFRSVLVYLINKELLSNNFGDSGDVGVSRIFFLLHSELFNLRKPESFGLVFFVQSAQNGISG